MYSDGPLYFTFIVHCTVMVRSDMEFVTNGTSIFILGNEFYRVILEKSLVYSDIALISSNLQNKQPVLPPFTSNVPKKLQKSTTKQQKMKLQKQYMYTTKTYPSPVKIYFTKIISVHS